MPDKMIYEMQALTFSLKANACIDEAKEKQDEIRSLMAQIDKLSKEMNELVDLANEHSKKVEYFMNKAKEAE